MEGGFIADLRHAIARQLARHAVEQSVAAYVDLPEYWPMAWINNPLLDFMVVIVGFYVLAMACWPHRLFFELFEASSYSSLQGEATIIMTVLFTLAALGIGIPVVADRVSSFSLTLKGDVAGMKDRKRHEQDAGNSHEHVPSLLQTMRRLQTGQRLVGYWRSKSSLALSEEDAKSIRRLAIRHLQHEVDAAQNQVEDIRNREVLRRNPVAVPHRHSCDEGDKAVCHRPSHVDPGNLAPVLGVRSVHSSSDLSAPDGISEIEGHTPKREAYRLAMAYVNGHNWCFNDNSSSRMPKFVNEDAPIERKGGDGNDINHVEQRVPSLAWRAFPFVRLTVLLALGAVLGAMVPLLHIPTGV